MLPVKFIGYLTAQHLYMLFSFDQSILYNANFCKSHEINITELHSSHDSYQ